MSLESLLLDPVEMNPGNAQLELVNRASGIDVVTFDAPHPDLNVLYASSMDTEGGISVASAYQNRTITLTVRCFDAIPGSGQMLSRIRELQQKVGTFQRQGGVLQRTLSTGQVVRFDITQDARVTVPADQMFTRFGSAICTLTLVCKPLGYGREFAFTFHTETTLPVLRFVEPSIPGDVPAYGRLVVNNDSGTDQAWAQVAWRSRTYDGTATAALFYEAETRLRQGGAILAARSGASGGTVVRQGTLTTSYQSMMSLATSGTVYAQHVGSHNLWARVYDPGGTAGATSGGTVGNVSLALEWAQGDLTQVTRNDPVSPPVINGYSIVDLGQVHLELAVSGAQRWDGRVIARGTQTNQSVDVDCVWLAPIGEGSMTVESVPVVAAPTVLTARDEFTGTTSGGTLTTRTPPIGAAWVEAGDTGSFTFSDNGFSTGSEEVQRTATSDSNGRFAVVGSSVINTEVGATVNTSNPLAQTGLGLVARYADTSNWLGASLSASTAELNVFRHVAGSSVNLGTGRIGGLFPIGTNFIYKLRLVVLANGFWFAGWFQSDDTLIVSISGFDGSLATGGALASGKGGLWDINGATAATRRYDNVYVATPPPPDAAVYAGQSLELRSDRVRREDSTGSVWGPVGKAEGQYLLVPPSGQEGRSTEFLVKLSRGGPTPAGDPAMDDVSAQLFVTPRYLNVGEI